MRSFCVLFELVESSREGNSIQNIERLVIFVNALYFNLILSNKFSVLHDAQITCESALCFFAYPPFD
uniref:Ovule protein n=1 Tax=Panagrellus redivivus TaxID=6233 RepID=A0A7E4ZZF5_PANRE